MFLARAGGCFLFKPCEFWTRPLHTYIAYNYFETAETGPILVLFSFVSSIHSLSGSFQK